MDSPLEALEKRIAGICDAAYPRPDDRIYTINSIMSEFQSVLAEAERKATAPHFVLHTKQPKVQKIDKDHISITSSSISFGTTKPPYDRVVIEYDSINKMIRFHEPDHSELGISYKMGINPASKVYGFRARPFIGFLPTGYYHKVSTNTYKYVALNPQGQSTGGTEK